MNWLIIIVVFGLLFSGVWLINYVFNSAEQTINTLQSPQAKTWAVLGGSQPVQHTRMYGKRRLDYLDAEIERQQEQNRRMFRLEMERQRERRLRNYERTQREYEETVNRYAYRPYERPERQGRYAPYARWDETHRHVSRVTRPTYRPRQPNRPREADSNDFHIQENG